MIPLRVMFLLVVSECAIEKNNSDPSDVPAFSTEAVREGVAKQATLTPPHPGCDD